MIVDIVLFVYFILSFFITILRQPRSTLFPYTTLFRSDSITLSREAWQQVAEISRGTSRGVIEVKGKRSEEHTSELQSLRHLVCRLLLEKKKKNKKNKTTKYLIKTEKIYKLDNTSLTPL